MENQFEKLSKKARYEKISEKIGKTLQKNPGYAPVKQSYQLQT